MTGADVLAVEARPASVPAPPPLLAVTDLHVTFSAGVHALRGVDLTLQRGEILAIVGESGSGKSVLGLTALGLLPDEAEVRGRAELAGVDMVSATAEVRRRVRKLHAGAVFQDPMTSLNPTMRIGQQVAEAAGSAEAAITALERAGVPQARRLARQYPHELSGGLRQRVMIAMAIAGNPDVVIADEPTTALDVTVQAQILALFAELRDTTGCSFVFVTHDLAVAATVADRIAVLYGGRLAEVGATADVLHRPAHPYTRGLLAARLDPEHDSASPLPTLPGEPPDPRVPSAGCPFAPRCAHAADGCRDALPALAPSVRHAGLDACIRSAALTSDVRQAQVREQWPPTPPPTSELALQLRGITKGFGRGRRTHVVVSGLDLDVRKGSCLALVGESGCGKTTTLRLAVGLERPDAGTVELGHGHAPQLVFQDAGASLTPWLRVGELLEERLRAAGLGRAERRERARHSMSLVGLPDAVLCARPGMLSGGQRQRVSLARAIVVPPALLACDEPISALDVSLAAVIVNLIGRLRRELDMAVLFVTHDLGAARVVADEVAVMADGRIVEHGTADEVLTRPQHPHTQRLLAAVPRLEREGRCADGRG